ncbi:hypothetical protein [Streptomyces sp. CB02460]|uniref:hypothetical protein n=1 Tax=Streptomyces sp. CB02460 TaxID=1703941 RepID=UPI000938B10F|nr:hypothetical protein [Streptomyces sp. CB02460]OKJ78232.1 hypothetical protein AMK30_04310 [Streptomyces sp. CB02460]
MSQSVPPPNQPYGQPQGGNPFAGQQPGAPFGGGPAPFTPAPPARNNIALGVVVALVAALVAAGIYGAIIGATKHEIGYAAVGVGAIVGFAAGKLGGRNPALPVVSGAFALLGVYLGQLLGEAIIISKQLPLSVTDIFFDHFSDLNTVWKEDSDFLSFVFFAIAAVVAFSTARKTAA